MKYLTRLLALVVVTLLITSCEDILNRKPLTEFPNSDVWSDPALAQTYVNQLYDEIPWSVARNAGNVDESRSRQATGFNVNNDLITPDNSGFGDWNGNYSKIRDCNKFLANIDKLESDGTEKDGVTLKDRMTGEVHFLRAIFYFNLVKYLGGVPIVKKVYGLNDDFKIPRNTFAESIDFIVKDLDAAAKLLPRVESGGDDGRATEGAALALKSRVLLYAASDLHNPQRNGAITNGYSNPEFLGYTSGDPMQRWQAAQDAAKAVIDLGVYSLYKSNPSSADEASQNYYDMFMPARTNEDIFVRYRKASLSEGYDGWNIAPNGWYANAGVGATWELTTAYEMQDGSKFDMSNPQEKAHPYKNRDPRFYGTIIYEGAKYRPRPPSLTEQDPVGVGQFGTWEKWDSEKNEMYKVYGLDTRNSSINPWNGNRCAATILKYLDKSVDIQKSNQDLTYRYIRYGEVLLNYAEASIELGQDAEARKYMNMIRHRAYMPDITKSGSALMDEYRNERRVELAYENQRFFDVRRWMIGPQAYHNIHGANIVYELQADHTTAEDPTISPLQIMTGKWSNREYFFPISRNEMNKNDMLVQNPGYE